MQTRKIGMIYVEPTQYPVKEKRVNNFFANIFIL